MSTNINSIDDLQGHSMDEVVRYLDKRIRALEEELIFDQKIRERYPALQDLYDQYQTVKVLVQR